jgi:hypothetical protein
LWELQTNITDLNDMVDSSLGEEEFGSKNEVKNLSQILEKKKKLNIFFAFFDPTEFPK